MRGAHFNCRGRWGLAFREKHQEIIQIEEYRASLPSSSRYSKSSKHLQTLCSYHRVILNSTWQGSVVLPVICCISRQKTEALIWRNMVGFSLNFRERYTLIIHIFSVFLTVQAYLKRRFSSWEGFEYFLEFSQPFEDPCIWCCWTIRNGISFFETITECIKLYFFFWRRLAE